MIVAIEYKLHPTSKETELVYFDTHALDLLPAGVNKTLIYNKIGEMLLPHYEEFPFYIWAVATPEDKYQLKIHTAHRKIMTLEFPNPTRAEIQLKNSNLSNSNSRETFKQFRIMEIDPQDLPDIFRLTKPECKKFKKLVDEEVINFKAIFEKDLLAAKTIMPFAFLAEPQLDKPNTNLNIEDEKAPCLKPLFEFKKACDQQNQAMQKIRDERKALLESCANEQKLTNFVQSELTHFQETLISPWHKLLDEKLSLKKSLEENLANDLRPIELYYHHTQASLKFIKSYLAWAIYQGVCTYFNLTYQNNKLVDKIDEYTKHFDGIIKFEKGQLIPGPIIDKLPNQSLEQISKFVNDLLKSECNTSWFVSSDKQSCLIGKLNDVAHLVEAHLAYLPFQAWNKFVTSAGFSWSDATIEKEKFVTNITEILFQKFNDKKYHLFSYINFSTETNIFAKIEAALSELKNNCIDHQKLFSMQVCAEQNYQKITESESFVREKSDAIKEFDKKMLQLIGGEHTSKDMEQLSDLEKILKQCQTEMKSKCENLLQFKKLKKKKEFDHAGKLFNDFNLNFSLYQKKLIKLTGLHEQVKKNYGETFAAVSHNSLENLKHHLAKLCSDKAAYQLNLTENEFAVLNKYPNMHVHLEVYQSTQEQLTALQTKYQSVEKFNNEDEYNELLIHQKNLQKHWHNLKNAYQTLIEFKRQALLNEIVFIYRDLKKWIDDQNLENQIRGQPTNDVLSALQLTLNAEKHRIDDLYKNIQTGLWPIDQVDKLSDQKHLLQQAAHELRNVIVQFQIEFSKTQPHKSSVESSSPPTETSIVAIHPREKETKPEKKLKLAWRNAAIGAGIGLGLVSLAALSICFFPGMLGTIAAVTVAALSFLGPLSGTAGAVIGCAVLGASVIGVSSIVGSFASCCFGKKFSPESAKPNSKLVDEGKFTFDPGCTPGASPNPGVDASRAHTFRQSEVLTALKREVMQTTTAETPHSVRQTENNVPNPLENLNFTQNPNRFMCHREAQAESQLTGVIDRQVLGFS